MVWVHTACHRGFINISADEKNRRLLLRLAHLGLLLFIDFSSLKTVEVSNGSWKVLDFKIATSVRTLNNKGKCSEISNTSCQSKV